VKAKVDTDRCVGHARCNAVAPNVFDLDDDGYAVGPGEELTGARLDEAYLGRDACPERAITVE
jgi:ferredoxin